MMLPYFENLVSGLENALSGKPPYIARKRLTLEIARLGTRLFSGEHRVAWCGVLAPFDLLNAMGVTSCYVEFVGGMLASTGMVEPILALAEQNGWSTDVCAYHRAVAGAASQGLLPTPDFLVATTAPCTGGLALIESLARDFDRDLFIINVPADHGPRGVEFLADQYRSLVSFVQDHTGRKLDPSRLARVIERSNRTRALLIEIFELAMTVPSPVRSGDLVNFGVILPLFWGTETAIDICRIYRDEFAEKVSAGVAGIEGEQLRLMWLQNRIQFKHPLIQMLEREHRAAIVIDELNNINWDPIDPADPYSGLARRTLSIPLTGSVEYRVENLKRLAAQYKVDGAINPCHWGCRQGTGARGLVEAGLREIGVPTLNLEVDCIDTRNFAEGQLRTRLEAFVEMLLAQKAA